MQELAVNTAYDYMQDEMLFGGQIELGPDAQSVHDCRGLLVWKKSDGNERNRRL